MKNIVNRALVAKKKQFLSKSVPRGTRTIWRYLGALFLIFTLGIGQMWADTFSAAEIIVQNEGKTEVIGATKNHVTVYSPGITRTSSQQIWKDGSTAKKEATVVISADASNSDLQNRSGSYIEIKADDGYTLGTTIGIRGGAKNSSAKIAPVVWWSGDVSATFTGAKLDLELPANTITSSDEADLQVTIPSGIKVVRIYRKVRLNKNVHTTFVTSNYDDIGGGSAAISSITATAVSAGYSVTYVENGHGANQTDLTGQTALPNPLPTLSESGWIFGGWYTDEGLTTPAVAGATLSANATLYAKWTEDTSVTKYSVTYVLNGPSGEAPTQADVASGTAITLADAPSWAGHAFDGWLCNIDSDVKAAGASYTMTAAATTFTAQWHEVDCKIYSLTGGIGSATVIADNASVSEDALVMSNTAGRIKLTPASGETFKTGDVVTISGRIGDGSTKNFGIKISNANDGKATLGTASVAYNTVPLIATVTLTGNADELYICRADGTTTTLYTCEVHRSCAEGAAAGLSYATAEVNKTEGDAAFTNALTNANSLVVAGYSSSNTAVATVDKAGQVTIVAPGTATITAHSAVQTKAGTLYAAGTATYTLNVAALPEYTVTYDLNGGSGDPTEVDHKAGEKFNLHDGVTGITAPTSKTFVNWKDQDDALFAGGAEYTMPAKDVTLTAQWAGDVYTVKFMDGETVLDTKVVEVGSHPADIEHPTKPLYTFAAWQLSGSDVILDDVSGAKDAVVTLTARWAKVYATSYDMEAYAASAGADKDGLEGELTAAGYAFTNVNGIDNGHTHNYIYDGMKYKTNDGDLSFNVNAGKLVIVKTGNLPANALTMYINGVADPTVFVGANEAVETHVNNYFYSEAEALYRLDIQASKGTCAIKAVNITDPFTVSFDANGGDDVASLNGTPSVTLPSATKGTESFLGWFTEATGGEKIGDAGESYTPTADITLHAQWEAVSTDARLSAITFSSDAGTLAPAFDPEVTSYTYTMPYGTAAIPTITGATSVNAKAQDPIIGDAAAAWGEAQTVKGVAQSGDKKTYTITMAKAPKDGVSIIKATINSTTKNTIGEVTGLYKKDASCGGLSGYKFNGKGAYIGIELVAGQTFNEGDIINIHTTQASTQGSIALYNDHGNTVSSFHDYGVMGGTGDNKFALPASAEDESIIYVCRTEANTWNGFVDYIEVTRAMNPVLTAITIDERAGVIDPLDDKHFNVQIPYEAVLANLTIVPTIAWNAPAAENSIVVNDGGAWVEGNNTYKLTDKDGDFTIYTLTLTRDVLKHDVKFYDGETLLETLEVEDGTNIAAGDVPADPTKEDYIFQGWAETAGGDVVDVTSFTISAAKNFYAKWAADGAIKLINKSTGAINTTNFITGVTATEANSEKAAAWGGTQGATISGTNQLNKVVQYNATTNQTKLQIKVYNTNNSDKYVYIHKIIEGKTTEESVETLTATSKTVVESEFYEFNDTKNRSFYLTTNSTDVKILQVKVIDDGATPMKQAGEAGYSLNLNKGRVVYYANSDVTFEGLALQSASNYSVISSSEFQTTKNISFSISSPVLLKVTTNSAKYYVSQNPDEDGTTATAITAAGTAEFELTETTNPWYLVPSTTSNVKYTNIAFELPKAATPVIETQPATNHTFDPGDMTATVVATVTEGTLHYQWYKKATVGDDEEVGTDAATLTTTTEGTYYVVVTNVLAGHQNTSVTSDEAELGYRVTNDATLSALSYGGTAITLEDGVYNYNVELAKGTTDVPALAATATMDGYATVTISNAAEFVSYAASSTVTVKSEDATVTNVYTVNFTVKHDLPQVDVTATTTWNWANAATTMQKIVPAEKDVEQLMANIDDEGKQLKNDAEFNSQALIFSGQEALEKSGSGANTRWFAKGGHIKFNVTVPGTVEVEFSDNGNNNRRVKINDAVSTVASASNTDVKTYKAYVQPGEVTLMGVKNDGTGIDQYIRISKIIFTANPTPDYTRNVSSNYGTLCVEHNVLVGGALGATFYQIASRNEDYDYKIDFEEVLPNEELKAGEPYLFKSNTGRIDLYYGEENAPTPIPVRGMIGNYAATSLEITEANKNTIYYFAQNKLYLCDNLVGGSLTLNDHRAYIDLTQVPTYAEYEASKQQQQNPAPRRRVSLEMNGEKIATGCENLNVTDKPVKMIINGQLFILRGEKMYDAKGQLVK